jgi:S1-C subfamily serine protease
MFAKRMLSFTKGLVLTTNVRRFVGSKRLNKTSTSSALYLAIAVATSTYYYNVNNNKYMVDCDAHDLSSLGRYSVSNVVAKASPAVVSILVDEGERRTLGSGYIISNDGFIVTCVHVVDNAMNNRVLVTLKNGRAIPATVWRKDAETDIAVIKLEEVPDNLPTLSFGKSSDLNMGDFVVAIGSPLGWTDSVSFGVVTNIGASAELGAEHGQIMLQTDATIFIGNSGGPLLNINGEVIGMNSCKSLTNWAYGYALPSDLVAFVSDKMVRKKRIVRPFLGMVVGDDYTFKHSKNLTTDSRAMTGSVATVYEVMWQSPAQRGGFKR